MLINERHDSIIEILKANRFANVKFLAKALFVSEATIRRDLTEMKNLGLIERTHGGASLPDNAEEVSIFVRMNENAKEKEIIASKTLPLLPDFHSVFIDSSSTAMALAERMDLSFKTVVTNNLQTAIQLSRKPNINLILLGGNVYYNTNSSTGSFTTKQLEEFSFDLVILSCFAIDKEEIFERSLEQKELKLTALKRGKYKVLLADHTKFSNNGIYLLGKLKDFNLFVSDAEIKK